jgi:hypothetical protein
MKNITIAKSAFASENPLVNRDIIGGVTRMIEISDKVRGSSTVQSFLFQLSSKLNADIEFRSLSTGTQYRVQEPLSDLKSTLIQLRDTMRPCIAAKPVDAAITTRFSLNSFI